MSGTIEDLVRISPPVWPGKSLQVQPGDLTLLASKGIGFADPMLVRPWDNPFSERYRSPAPYYAYEAHAGDPFRDAPVNEGAGGTVYFDGQPDERDVQALVRLLDVRRNEKKYAVFLGHADHPQEERYLTQLRIVARFGLRYMFDALTGEEYESFPDQSLTIGDLAWRFIQNQQEVWGVYDSPQLLGAMGGDGDWAKEALAFGLMVENAYHGVYRLWSRAWLVTK